METARALSRQRDELSAEVKARRRELQREYLRKNPLPAAATKVEGHQSGAHNWAKQAGASEGLSAISKMTGLEFEAFVRDRLRQEGYTEVRTTKQSGDFGADLVVLSSNRTIVIQCKRYRDTVGLSAVQQVHAAKSHYGAHEAWVITDSTYSKEAQQLAKTTGVRLRTIGLDGIIL